MNSKDAQTAAATAPTGDANRWPKQIKFIIGNEACERFSYYGMKSILALYITGVLLQTDDKATTVIHLFGFANYFLPLFGAWVSDRFWGRYNTILWLSLFYCAGHGVLALGDRFGTVDAKLLCLYGGLGLIAFGSGGIKPCVSAFVGDQFRDNQAHLLQKAYGAFYFAINFGSFFGFLAIPWLKNNYGYGWAFGVPGILMGLATLIFLLGTRHYVRKPPARNTKIAGFLSVYLCALRNFKRNEGGLMAAVATNFLSTIGLPLLAIPLMVYVSLRHSAAASGDWIGQLTVGILVLWYVLLLGATLKKWTDLPDSFWSAAKPRFNGPEVSAARSVSPILAVFAWIPIFWALFEQSMSTWVLQGKKMIPWTALDFDAFGGHFKWVIGAEQMESLNSLLVMILVPLFTLWLYPTVERAGVRVSQLRRMSVGMIVAASCYLLVAWLQKQIDGGAHMSVLWQSGPYIIITAAEVLVSVTGLEFAFQQAAPSMKSAVMSFWLVTNGIGQLIIALVTSLGGGKGNASVSPGRFLFYALLTFVVAGVFIVVAVCYRERKYEEA